MNHITLAAFTVLQAHQSGKGVEHFRLELLAAGVHKGTVSKACTILKSLRGGIITRSEVTSISRAYDMIRERTSVAERAAALQEEIAKHSPGLTVELELSSLALFLAKQGWHK